jgi:hypothetical protein
VKEMSSAFDTTVTMLKQLKGRLAWTIWRKLRPCPPDQVEFVAMYPIGDTKDHWFPGCRTLDDMSTTGSSYWMEPRMRLMQDRSSIPSQT